MAFPKSMEDLRKYHLSAPENGSFRSSQVDEEYKIYLKLHGKHLADILTSRYFTDPKVSDWIYDRNPFPYNISPDITHLIAWIKPGHVVTEITIVMDLRSKEVHDLVVFHNVQKMMSIPQLDHIHVFVRQADLSKIPLYHKPAI